MPERGERFGYSPLSMAFHLVIDAFRGRSSSREEVHQPSEQAHYGQNYQAHNEQIFHHPLTASFVEQMNHS
jgi:hypothetical protein